jgi:hypothetical protein
VTDELNLLLCFIKRIAAFFANEDVFLDESNLFVARAVHDVELQIIFGCVLHLQKESAVQRIALSRMFLMAVRA